MFATELQKRLQTAFLNEIGYATEKMGKAIGDVAQTWQPRHKFAAGCNPNKMRG